MLMDMNLCKTFFERVKLIKILKSMTLVENGQCFPSSKKNIYLRITMEQSRLSALAMQVFKKNYNKYTKL